MLLQSDLCGYVAEQGMPLRTEQFHLLGISSQKQKRVPSGLPVNVGRSYGIFFVIPFYLQSVPVHSTNCVKKNIYNDMYKSAE
jgi:hypothetical protein